MRARKAASLGFLILVIAMFSALGCGGGSSSGSQSNQGPPPPPSLLGPQVTIAPAAVTLTPGGTQTFTATVKGPVNTNVTWTVQEAAGGAVNSAGSYTAPIATGFYHVVATSAADTTVTGNATISVTTDTGRFIPTADMVNARGFHTATLLTNGQVLVAGGATLADPLCIGGIGSAELYDSVAGSFTPTGSMTTLRYAHTATLLPIGGGRLWLWP